MDLAQRRIELQQKLNELVIAAEQVKGALAILDEQLAEPQPNRAERRRKK